MNTKYKLKKYPVVSSFMTNHRSVTKVTRRVPHVEQELLTFPEHPGSARILVGFVYISIFSFLCSVGYCLSFPLFSIVWPIPRFTASNDSYSTLFLWKLKHQSINHFPEYMWYNTVYVFIKMEIILKCTFLKTFFIILHTIFKLYNVYTMKYTC